MRRLTAQDAAFLYLETPKTPMHVGSVTLFGPTDMSPEVIYERFRAYTAARLHLLPSYWRQLQTTYGITQPLAACAERQSRLPHAPARAARPRHDGAASHHGCRVSCAD